MNDPMLPLPGLSSASGKPVVVKFDGGLLSSDGGVLALREVEQRLRVADRLADSIIDPRAADQITHSLADVIRFRLLMISAGYEDGNDANSLRRDPMFKMALDLSPIDRELCSQSTISRLENLPDIRALLRMGRAQQTPQEGLDLLAARPLGGTKHGGDEAALAVNHDDRLKSVFVVVGVEQPQLLTPVGRGSDAIILRSLRG